MNERMSKRGMSEILATLLIILLVLAIAAIIWVVVRNFVKGGTEDVELSGLKISLDIESAQLVLENSLEVVKVTVSRGSGKGNLTGIRFIFTDDENSYPIDKDVLMAEHGKHTFRFNSTDLDVDLNILTEVSVAPIYKTGDTQKVGGIKDTSEITSDIVNLPGTFSLTVTKAGTGAGIGTVTSVPAGINCGSTCSYNYDSETSVTLTATPGASNTFTGWSGGGCSGTGTCTVTMDAAKTVTATFTVTTTQYLLTVTKVPSIGGTVTSNITGISCGTDCTENYNSGTKLTLTASTATGYTFTGWSGACSGTGTCIVTMDSAKTVTATFTATTTQYELILTKAGDGLGTVTSTSNPTQTNQINCGTACTTQTVNYNPGTSVTLTAQAALGDYFCSLGPGGGWGGDCLFQYGTCTLTMNSAKTVIASFYDLQCPVP